MASDKKVHDKLQSDYPRYEMWHLCIQKTCALYDTLLQILPTCKRSEIERSCSRESWSPSRRTVCHLSLRRWYDAMQPVPSQQRKQQTPHPGSLFPSGPRCVDGKCYLGPLLCCTLSRTVYPVCRGVLGLHGRRDLQSSCRILSREVAFHGIGVLGPLSAYMWNG